VEPPTVGTESDINEDEDEDRIDEMIADISRKYEIGSGVQAPLSEV
jgi:hypothetical protein